MAVSKSAEAFRTISEAANEIDVPQHVLRHWEEVFGQIRPMRRAGGRRYYRPIDIDMLRGVRVLLYDERYTTKGVQKIFKEQGAKYIAELGRLAAAGQSVEFRPTLEDGDASPAAKQENPFRQTASSASDGKDAAPKPVNGVAAKDTSPETPDNAAVPPLSDQAHKVLTALLHQLEEVQTSIDEAALAIEAIAPDTASTSRSGTADKKDSA